MGQIFLRLLNISITAGYIIGAVLVLRLLLKKSPKWIRCLLWVIVGLRLVIPFTVESSFSIIPSANTIVESTEEGDRRYVVSSGITSIDNRLNPVIKKSQTVTTSEPIQTPQNDIEGSVKVTVPGVEASDENVIDVNNIPTEKENIPEKDKTESTSETVDYKYTEAEGEPVSAFDEIITVAGYVWAAGFGIMLIYSCFSVLRIRRQLREAVRTEGGVYFCDTVKSPFIFGVLFPKIYLPFNMDDESVEYILSHEKAHLKRGDHLWKPLGYLILSVYWFNPLVWVAYIILCRDIELACDERVIRKLDKAEIANYSRALLRFSAPRRFISACPVAFGEVGVKERVKTVLNYKKPAFWIIIMAVVICAVTSVCLLTNPISKSTSSENDAGTSEKTESENKELEEKYQAALKFLENKEYENAYKTFAEVGDYKDSTEKITHFAYVYTTDNITFKSGQLGGTSTSKYEYTYDDNGRLTKKKATSPEQYEISAEYYYDENGNNVKEVDAYSDSQIYSYDNTYDENGKILTSILNQNDNTDYKICTEYFYDTGGHLIKKTYLSNGEAAETSYEYSDGFKVREIDGEGLAKNIAEYSYDNYGRLAEYYWYELDEDESQIVSSARIKFLYDEYGVLYKKTCLNITGSTSESTTETFYTYNEKGDVLKTVKYVLGSTTTTEYSYDDNGNPVKVAVFNDVPYDYLVHDYSGYKCYYYEKAEDAEYYRCGKHLYENSDSLEKSAILDAERVRNSKDFVPVINGLSINTELLDEYKMTFDEISEKYGKVIYYDRRDERNFYKFEKGNNTAYGFDIPYDDSKLITDSETGVEYMQVEDDALCRWIWIESPKLLFVGEFESITIEDFSNLKGIRLISTEEDGIFSGKAYASVFSYDAWNNDDVNLVVYHDDIDRIDETACISVYIHPQNIQQEKISESNKSCYLLTNAECIYQLRLFDKEGTEVFSENYYRKPTLYWVDENLLRIEFSVGFNNNKETRNCYYYDLQSAEVSDSFYNVYDESDGKVLYLYSERCLVIESIFNEEYLVVIPDLKIENLVNGGVKEAWFSEDGIIGVVYTDINKEEQREFIEYSDPVPFVPDQSYLGAWNIYPYKDSGSIQINSVDNESVSFALKVTRGPEIEVTATKSGDRYVFGEDISTDLKYTPYDKASSENDKVNGYIMLQDDSITVMLDDYADNIKLLYFQR